MANISITAANVVPGAQVVKVTGVAGTTITAGQLLYKDSGDSNKLKLADANGTGDALVVAGIALCGASAGQPVTYATRDADLTIGATVAIGDVLIASGTAGAIAPVADLASGMYATVVAVATSTTKVSFHATALVAGAAKA